MNKKYTIRIDYDGNWYYLMLIREDDVVYRGHFSKLDKVLWTQWRDPTFKVKFDMQLEGVNHVCTFCFYDEV